MAGGDKMSHAGRSIQDPSRFGLICTISHNLHPFSLFKMIFSQFLECKRILFDRFLCRPPKARCPVAWRCVTKWPILSVTPWIINTPPSHSWFTIWKRESESGSFQESIIDYLKITHSRRRTGMLVIFTHVLDRLPDRALKTIFIVPVSNLIGLIHLGAPNRDYRASQ